MTPRSAKALFKLAEEHSWQWHESWFDDEWYQLLLWREDTTLVAIWKDGKLYQGWLILDEPISQINLKTFKEIMAEPEPLEWGWRSLEERLQQLNDEGDMELRDKMRDEYEMCGFYISGHPLDLIDRRYYPDVVDTAAVREVDLRSGTYVYPEGEKLDFLGIVDEIDKKNTKRGGKPFATFMLTDETGGVPCIVFGADCHEMDAGMLVHVTGAISERNEAREIRALRVREVLW